MELFMSLKKLTDAAHREAEQTKWAQLLISGDMTNRQYGQYLYNQLQIYSALESRAHELKLFTKYPILNNLKRVNAISGDMMFFKYKSGLEPTTQKYLEYANTLNETEVLAHMYVRHFGDMHGGQIIKSKLPEPILEAFEKDSDGNTYVTEEWWTGLYAFENKYETIKYVRSLLTLEMADEANTCFRFAIDLFYDLEKRFDL